MSPITTPSTAIVTRFTFGAFALSLFALGCDPQGEPVSDDELFAAEDEDEAAEDVDALAATPADEDELEPAADDEVDAPPAGGSDAPAPVSHRDPGFDLVAETGGMAYEWGQWFSEEDPASTCRTNSLLTGVQCTGWYCDAMQLECHPGVGTLGQSSWSTWFSEEGTSWRICDGNRFVSGMTCSGGWCDNLSLECTETSANPAAHTCIWSGYFSDTDPAFLAPGGYAVKGVQCSGANCTSMRYYYCPIG